MATSIRTVTTTGGIAEMKRAANIMTRDRRPPLSFPSRHDRRPPENALDFTGRNERYRGIQAGDRTGRVHAARRRSMRGGPMRGLLRGVCAVALVIAVAAAGSVTSVSSQTKPAPRKLDLAYLLAPPESGAVGLKFMAEEVTRRSNGSINMV